MRDGHTYPHARAGRPEGPPGSGEGGGDPSEREAGRPGSPKGMGRGPRPPAPSGTCRARDPCHDPWPAIVRLQLPRSPGVKCPGGSLSRVTAPDSGPACVPSARFVRGRDRAPASAVFPHAGGESQRPLGRPWAGRVGRGRWPGRAGLSGCHSRGRANPIRGERDARRGPSPQAEGRPTSVRRLTVAEWRTGGEASGSRPEGSPMSRPVPGGPRPGVRAPRPRPRPPRRSTPGSGPRARRTPRRSRRRGRPPGTR